MPTPSAPSAPTPRTIAADALLALASTQGDDFRSIPPVDLRAWSAGWRDAS